MDARILDLDGSILHQRGVAVRGRVVPLRDWGPPVRLACGFGRFRQLEQTLAQRLGSEQDATPALTLFGSGDFHHVSLALVRRLTTPVNLLVFDKHPDWMRGVPLLHCGTWLYHAARLPHVERVFHVGGELDFDNGYRWLAPWPLLRSGKIVVLPALRRFQRGGWASIRHEPLRAEPDQPADLRRVETLLRPYRDELARRPLYVSFDKDVLTAADAAVNWDSGLLRLTEAVDVLDGFLRLAGGRLAGADLLGDWSPVMVRGGLRRLLHWSEHPRLVVDADDAAARNEQANLTLMTSLMRWDPAARASYRHQVAFPGALRG